MIRGRPVLFLVTVLGGWTALRVTMAFTVPPVMVGHQAQLAGTAKNRDLPSHLPNSKHISARRIIATEEVHILKYRPPTRYPGKPTIADDDWPSEAEGTGSALWPVFAETPRPNLALNRFAPGAGLSPFEAGLPRADEPRHWAGGAWMLWRNDDNSAGYARGPRLGGSQTGVRIDYAITPDSALRPALYGRLSSALRDPAAVELAGGFAIRPRLPLPLTIAVERREGLSPGGRSAFALLAAGGINPVDIGGGFRLDGYVQAGLVGLRQRDGFADGRLTVERPLANLPSLALGGGIWGAVQPGVSRLDIGPQASLRLRLADATLRIGAEWRERVAGNASPSSGPALSIGTDF